jgi:hypothetical protein
MRVSLLAATALAIATPVDAFRPPNDTLAFVVKEMQGTGP